MTVALFATACNPRAPATPKLPVVSPLPSPSPQPLIKTVAPTGDVDTLAQVRVIFTSDLLPLERLESPDEATILAHFSIDPALPGHFRVLTPKMIGFEAERAWPASSRIRVTITKGLKDRAGHELASDVAWTFQTPAIELTDLPTTGGNYASPPTELKPKISFSANLPLDRDSLTAHATLRAHDDAHAQPVPLVVPPDTAKATPGPSAAPEEQYDATAPGSFNYVLTPSTELAKGTLYDVVIEPGVMPRDGNRPSDKAFHGQIQTHDALKYVGMQSTEGRARFTTGQPKLQFTAPIDDKSLAALTLSPAPPKGSTPFATIYDNGVVVNTSLLAPQTDYTVSIGPSLKDTFGQQLGTTQTATFRTGDLSPDVWAPSGLNLFPSARDVRLNVIAVNAPPNVRATFRPLKPADVVLNDDPYGDTSSLLGASTSWAPFDVRGPKNVTRTVEVPLKAKLGAPAGALAYGVSAKLPGYHDPFTASGVVQLTDLGTFAEWFPDGGLVRVNRISDGTPVAGAQVEIYPSQAGNDTKSSAQICASAMTAADGAARFPTGTFSRCAATDKGDETAPPFVTIVRNGADWTYVRTSDGSGAYSGDFYNGWSAAKPAQRGTVFSDRDLYQPGETAQLTAVGWFLTDGVLRRGIAPSYALTLEKPNGDKTDLGRRSLDAFGEFSVPVALPANAPLGYYTIRASSGTGEEISGSFRVAQFKPPNFKVDLTLDHDVVQRGATVNATANNAYLFGAPLTGAKTHFVVTRSPQAFTPKGRDDYQFGRQWFWPEEQPDASTDVLDTTATVDATGKSATSVSVAGDLPFPMQYEVDAETTDPSNVAVADSKTFTALPSDTLIGVRTDGVGTAGQPVNIDVLATDPSGKPRGGTNVHLELQLATYNYATQIVEGSEQGVQSVSYSTVASTDTTTSDKAVTIKLNPTKPGTYRIRAIIAGTSDSVILSSSKGAASPNVTLRHSKGDTQASNPTETDAELYVGGTGAAAWYTRDPNQLTVKLDKRSYKPGDTATVLVQSPFPTADLHVMVVRHGVLWETTIQTTSAAPTVTFKVTPQMLPNAAVQAFLVRRGPPPQSDMPDTGNALARTGFAPFSVALDGKYITATVRTDHDVTQPAAQQTVHVHLTDLAKHPLQGEATLMVVNEAVLRLTGYRPPDLVKEVYAEQPISVRYADNRSQLTLKTIARPVEKGWGFGGGISNGDTDPRVRRKFSPIAYFGALHTDANGNAIATFTLPDDLTTWRAMVVTATADGRFGNADTTFRTTKPLVANPVMPQFARPGDTFEGGVAITNGTGATGALHITASLAGPLAFLVNDKPSQTTAQDAQLGNVTQAYRFPIVANGTGNSTVTIKVTGAGTGDAFAIPLPVSALDVLESVAQTGTTDTHATIGIDVAADTPRDAGGLDISLASTLIPEVTVAADKALRGDDRITLSAAARLAIASDLLILAKRTCHAEALEACSKASANTRDRALVEISTLDALHRADGGFAAYRLADRSDPYDSLFALSALARAATAFSCHAEALEACATITPLENGAKTYAAAVLADPTAHAKWCTSDQCKAELRLKALTALTDAGDRRTTFLTDIDALHDKLSFADQARLARLLRLAPEYHERATSLTKVIDDHLYATARGAAVTLPARYVWYDDPVVAQSQALRLELVRNAPGELIDRLTRSLLDMRRNGSFGCTCENAAALDALVDLAVREVPANFTASASIGPKTIVEQRFTGARTPERRARVAMRDLPSGQSQLTFTKTGTGTLHYAATYSYRLAGNAPGAISGLRITRVVREANTNPVLATMGLALPGQPLSIPAAHGYDIELQIISDHPVERVLITDPLPAGLEAVDTSFATTSKALKVPATDWKIGDQQIRTDRIEAYADHLDAGIYRLHYLARTVTPGTFTWPGANASLIGRADEFGRSATSVVVVK